MIGVALASIAALSTTGVRPLVAQEPFVQITFLDVGQGDAVVARAPGGEAVLIDAGPASPLRFLQQMGVDQVDLLVATHPHDDHIGGMVDVLTARPVHAFVDNGTAVSSDRYLQLMATLERLSEVSIVTAPGPPQAVGAMTVQLLPLSSDGAGPDGPSVATVLRFGAFSAFLSGDSERAELTALVEGGHVPDVTLLKAPHHGSARGFTRDFLDVARPEVVVISVGADNPFDHPRPEAMTAYTTVARHVMRTDRDGPVSVLGYADGSYEIVRGEEQESVGEGRFRSRLDAEGRDGAESGRGAESGLVLEVVTAIQSGGPVRLNTESVAVRNLGSAPMDIGGWRVCDLSSRCFRFPDDARIDAGGRVVVYSGYGTTDGRSYFMNGVRSVWNSNGDEAALYDAAGTLVVRYVYE